MSMIKVSDLKEGDLVDLEGDPYADPKSQRAVLKYMLAEVQSVEREALDCICVYFDFDAVGFSSDHLVRVVNR